MGRCFFHLLDSFAGDMSLDLLRTSISLNTVRSEPFFERQEVSFICRGKKKEKVRKRFLKLSVFSFLVYLLLVLLYDRRIK